MHLHSAMGVGVIFRVFTDNVQKNGKYLTFLSPRSRSQNIALKKNDAHAAELRLERTFRRALEDQFSMESVFRRLRLILLINTLFRLIVYARFCKTFSKLTSLPVLVQASTNNFIRGWRRSKTAFGSTF